LYFRNVSEVNTKGLSFEIDKLTNSIENIETGEIFETVITQLTLKDKSLIKKMDWQFNWHNELKDSTKLIFKLSTSNNPTIIQGLLSIEDKNDHIYLHLIESAKFNKGKQKIYLGVAGNLVAFSCKVSFEKGYDGFVAFDAKTSLIKHYQETLLATHFRGLKMYIESKAADRLIKQYFKN
jgi:hypothetical protein